MILYSLACGDGHTFEAWFRSIADFEAQQSATLIACPTCGATSVDRQPMAPAVIGSAKRRRTSKTDRASELSMPTTACIAGPSPEVREAIDTLKALKKKIIATSDDVGKSFAEEARKIHFGEVEQRNIRGEASAEEAQALADDGIAFGVLPTLPDDAN